MYILRISNIKKKFVIDEQKENVVLNNISLMFANNGLYSIVGKSGSGKSTLLNLIALMEEPTNGAIYFNNENIFDFKEQRKNEYRNKDIGFIFQHYHLLENESVLFNIMLPALIMGKSQKEAEFATKNLLNSVNFNKNLYEKKCCDLSGGEKERVAILRAIINDPKIILADEPTGALDSKNSLIFMEMLKEISKTRLVILVSHNDKLVKKYSDSIIYLKDGHIDSIKDKKKIKYVDSVKKKTHHHKKNNWIRHLSISNFKRRLKRNVVSIVSLVIGLVSSMLIIGFANGSKDSIKKSSYLQLDYGVTTFYKETTQSIPGSKISLVKMNRPNEEELKEMERKIESFYIEPNADMLLPSYPNVKSGDSLLEKIGYYPIYSFKNSNRNLLLKGYIPEIENSFEVVINKTAYEYLKKTFNSEPLGLELSISYKSEYHTYFDDVINPVITDYFIYEKNIHIVGVVDDFNFLSTPKIYYSYLSFKQHLQDSLLINLSKHENRNISWYQRLLDCGNEDSLSSYSYRLFLKEKEDNEILEKIVDDIPKPYKLDSQAIATYLALEDLISAASMGMSIFLIIALVGTALILGIISFSSYSEDKKTSAILTCIGANKKNILSIYLMENLFIGLLALFFSFAISPTLSLLINIIIKNITSFNHVINIPFISYMSIPLLLPLLIISITFLICLLSTYIPLFFSKKISPKEELREE